MNFATLFAAVLLCGIEMFASGAPLPTNCKIPTDLNNHYEKFRTPAEYIPSSVNQTLHRGETTCPKTLPTSGETKDRSSCPWYNKIITDSTLYPSVQPEAVCRCRDCIGSDGMHHCEAVYQNMFFLQRTSVCVDGFFVYEPITKYIPIRCVCAHKSIKYRTDNDYDYDI